MLELFDVGYNDLNKYSEQLYRLRKKTFSDRLNWDVTCSLDMEFDDFDNSSTSYILGVYRGQLIGSVRFISLKKPNMITHTFHDYFSDVPLPIIGVESSRFFVDKTSVNTLGGNNFSFSRALFLAMVSWAQHNKYEGIYTIVSRPMLVILKRTGWRVKVLKEALFDTTKKEKIYLLYLPADMINRAILGERLLFSSSPSGVSSSIWPLTLPVL